MTSKQQKTVTRQYAERPQTAIWQEDATADNPYITKRCRLHGYDMHELMQGVSFAESVYLMFWGELPDADSLHLFEQLCIIMMNPGPRHPATRATMMAGVSKTNPVNLLPIGATIMGGAMLGAVEVAEAMRFMRTLPSDPTAHAQQLLTKHPHPVAEEISIIPGFGRRYGGIDRYIQRAATLLAELPGAGSALQWGERFALRLNEGNAGWLATGLAASILTDLGLAPREGACLFQWMSAPGYLAHGLEQTHKPITAMPMVKDEDYDYAEN